MKKFIPLIGCMMLIMSMFTMTAFASDAEAVETSISENNSNSEIMPYANPTDLYYETNRLLLGKNPVTVTPTKGRSLRVWVKNSDTIFIRVYSSGNLIFSEDYYKGERDIEVVSSCNGNSYVVEFVSSDFSVIYSTLIYETGG